MVDKMLYMYVYMRTIKLNNEGLYIDNIACLIVFVISCNHSPTCYPLHTCHSFVQFN